MAQVKIRENYHQARWDEPIIGELLTPVNAEYWCLPEQELRCRGCQGNCRKICAAGKLLLTGGKPAQPWPITGIFPGDTGGPT